MRASILPLFLVVLAGCPGGSGKGGDSVSAASGDTATGASLFAANCASCHGADAQGGAGPNIVGVSDSSGVVDTILNGTEGMPAFADTLSDQDVSDIIAWLQSLGSGSGGGGEGGEGGEEGEEGDD